MKKFVSKEWNNYGQMEERVGHRQTGQEKKLYVKTTREDKNNGKTGSKKRKIKKEKASDFCYNLNHA